MGLVYLFGSYAENTPHEISDIDIGVIFKENYILENNANSLYLTLYDIFTDVFPEKSIDIVFLQRVGLELCFDVIRHGKVIYESSMEERLNFEQNIFRNYIDFKPLLNQFDKAVLGRVNYD